MAKVKDKKQRNKFNKEMPRFVEGLGDTKRWMIHKICPGCQEAARLHAEDTKAGGYYKSYYCGNHYTLIPIRRSKLPKTCPLHTYGRKRRFGSMITRHKWRKTHIQRKAWGYP